jgi:hemolysin activation/secretion protein
MTLSLRGVGGSALSGDLPPQRAFMVGGVDGLRAHSFAAFRGDQVALGQLEYSAAIGRIHHGDFENGLHAIVFIDAGRAWTHPGSWDVGSQPFAVDGGFGVSTAEDNVRVYFAKNLQDPDSDFVISARLQRPF